jgi:hypothetical protein
VLGNQEEEEVVVVVVVVVENGLVGAMPAPRVDWSACVPSVVHTGKVRATGTLATLMCMVVRVGGVAMVCVTVPTVRGAAGERGIGSGDNRNTAVASLRPPLASTPRPTSSTLVGRDVDKVDADGGARPVKLENEAVVVVVAFVGPD